MFSGKSPSSLNILTFSPVWIVWVGTVNTLFVGPDVTTYLFSLVLVPIPIVDPAPMILSSIWMCAVTVAADPTWTDNASSTFAPTR